MAGTAPWPASAAPGGAGATSYPWSVVPPAGEGFVSAGPDAGDHPVVAPSPGGKVGATCGSGSGEWTRVASAGDSDEGGTTVGTAAAVVAPGSAATVSSSRRGSFPET